jgi:hypothetical protein
MGLKNPFEEVLKNIPANIIQNKKYFILFCSLKSASPDLA